MKSIGRKLIAFMAGLGMLFALSACGGELNCEDAAEAVEQAESRYLEYDGNSLDVERELRDKLDYAQGDMRRACGLLNL